uniref:NADH-ubiquinone oxidoreductase chain 6 n=1 Tax=Epuraea sp. TaxID=2789194 RepID=A0A8F0L9C8_9CUCU|nr:NADH dehydrogenase subunit 6 [Epuraea sp.]
MNFLFSICLSLSFIFIFLNHPLSLGMILLIQTIIVSLISGKLSYNYWFSYILFLVMIGGLLILFIYMTSITSNKKFKFSFKLFSLIIYLSIMTLFILSINQFIFNNFSINMDMTNFIMNKSNSYSSIKFFNNPNYMIMIMIFNYLLITLIAVTKISKTEKGPLRQKF